MGKRYDKEFKIEAMRLVSEPGNPQSQVQRDLGIGQGMISQDLGSYFKSGFHPLRGALCSIMLTRRAGLAGRWFLLSRGRFSIV